jgi:DNA-directed RNA polymerase subunit beta'
MPERKGTIIEETEGHVDRVEKQYQAGVITEGERYNQIVDLWTHARERVGEEMMTELKTTRATASPT